MTGSKSKLIIRKKRRKVDVVSESVQQEFLKNLLREGKEANRTIRGDVVDGIARFWNHYNLCEFAQEWVVGEA
jgi:hypothetical protein